MIILNPSFVNQCCPSCHYEETISNGNKILNIIINKSRFSLPTAQVYLNYNSFEFTFELCSDYEYFELYRCPDGDDYLKILDEIRHRFFGIGSHNPDVRCFIKPVGRRVLPNLLK